MTEMTIGEAASQLDDLVRRLAGSREPVVITDDSGATALLVAPQVIKDLEDSLAVADHRRRQAEGTLGQRDRQPTGSRNSSRLPTGSSE